MLQFSVAEIKNVLKEKTTLGSSARSLQRAVRRLEKKKVLFC